MRPILRGIKITIFLLGATTLSSFIVIQSPRPTQAEGLLYKIGCVAGNLLDHSCQKSVQKTQPTTTTTTSPEPVTTSPPESEPAPTSSPPLEIEPTLLTDLPLVSKVTKVVVAMPPPQLPLFQYPAHILQTTQSDDRGVLGSTSRRALLIETTDQGWKFLGILWYWWFIVILGTAGLIVWLQPTLLKSFLSLPDRK